MDQDVADDACAWARRYIEVVERFDLCPWAAPARARGEVWIAACDVDDVLATLERFDATPDAAVGLVCLPAFTGDLPALRRLRNSLTDSPLGARLALAEFHPDAPLDDGNAARLVPYLRRSPDPLLQAVRHSTLSGLRRGGTTLVSVDQASILAGKPIVVPRDVADDVADVNLARLRSDRAALTAALDDLVNARRRDGAARARSG